MTTGPQPSTPTSILKIMPTNIKSLQTPSILLSTKNQKWFDSAVWKFVHVDFHSYQTTLLSSCARTPECRNVHALH